MVRIQHAAGGSTRFSCLRPLSRALLSALLLFGILVLSACGASTGGPPSTQTSPTAQPTSAETPEATVTTASSPAASATPATGYTVKVYFSKFPDSLNDSTAVFPVKRMSPTLAVATFSIQLLLAGPTLSERSAGYFSEFNSILTGPSSCSGSHPTGGPDFTLRLNVKGTAPAPGTATLRLCRATASPGVGADARILAEITATLKQFSNIQTVVVLDKNGNCFGDESGLNHCLA